MVMIVMMAINNNDNVIDKMLIMSLIMFITEMVTLMSMVEIDEDVIDDIIIVN